MQYNFDFIDRFNYPPSIRNQFRTILDKVNSYLRSERVCSVILYGSTSRGELSYKIRYQDGKIDLFSDYELWVITEKYPSKKHVNFLPRPPVFIPHSTKGQTTYYFNENDPQKSEKLLD